MLTPAPGSTSGAPGVSAPSGALRRLHPGSFAAVMATGILSIDTHLLGPAWLSRALLAVAATSFGALLVATTARVACWPATVLGDLRDPTSAFGFFTLVAGTNVLAVRLLEAGHPRSALALAAFGGAVWLVLTYAIPLTVLLTPRAATAARHVDAGWLLWVVATQSVAVVGATLAVAEPSAGGVLADVAVSLWGIGLALYLLVTGVIVLGLLRAPPTPSSISPSLWITMGAGAISVLAGGRILELSSDIPVVRTTASLIDGLCFVLWAVGTWLIPFLLGLGLWRHAITRWPIDYEASLWSIVFPIGMYAASSDTYAKAAGIAFLRRFSVVSLWCGVAALIVVSGLGLRRWVLRRRPAPAPR